MRFLDFIGSSALSSYILFYLAVWAELNSLNNRINPPTIQHLALVLLATHNSISLLHAYAFLNWALYVIHFLGLVLHIAFIIAYLRVSVHWKRFSFQAVGAIILLASFLPTPPRSMMPVKRRLTWNWPPTCQPAWLSSLLPLFPSSKRTNTTTTDASPCGSLPRSSGPPLSRFSTDF